MIALGGAVYAALMGMDNSNNKCHDYCSHHEEPLEYQTDVIFKFQILSDKGYGIKNILEEQFNKPSDFITSFPPIYEITDEDENAFELKMIKAPYKLHHSQIIELLSDNGLISGEDYILSWIFGSWNRETKEFNL
jgi:hypothetical protein